MTVHIIGAGLSGLAAAVRLSAAGQAVAIYEAAPQAGGRCRSFFDTQLERTIDNGNHLLMAANRAALAYLSEIGADNALVGPEAAEFPFVDLGTDERWTLRPNRGLIPWWLFSPSRRIPGTHPFDYLSGLRMAFARKKDSVLDVLGPNDPLYARFWEPLTLAAINTDPSEAAAAPLGAVLRRTFALGARACRPLVAREGLSKAFIDPALAWLAARGTVLAFGHRLTAIECENALPKTLVFGDRKVGLASGDRLLISTRPSIVQDLLPEQTVPEEGVPIVNAHFRLDRPPERNPGLFVGVLGSPVHWIFVRDDVVSVTVSGAKQWVDTPAETLLDMFYRDVARVLGLGPERPKGRIVKERRATFSQTPENLVRRPKARTSLKGVFLAGDWTDTGLPATIEGAVQSGHTAAREILRSLA